MASIQVEGLCRRYDERAEVGPISFDVASGEFFSLLGPSGCGKSTSLRCIAGFEHPDRGEIRIGGEAITKLPPHKRNIGIVFQSFALFPHLSVQHNVEFGLRMRGEPKDGRRRRASDALARVGLTGFADRYPGELSGVQQQRVALARAIVLEPPVLLMDEPLSSLDLKLRVQMRAEIRRLQRQLGLTLIYVTHDQDEALSMSDRIAVMAEGKVEQIGTPRDIYERPSSARVASFIGSVNLLEIGTVEANGHGLVGKTTDGFSLFWPQATGDRPKRVALRPERIRLCQPGQDVAGDNRLSGTVENIEFLGADIGAHVRLDQGGVLQIELKSGRPDGDPKPGDRTEIVFSSADLVPIVDRGRP